jgi:hypothetical protein
MLRIFPFQRLRSGRDMESHPYFADMCVSHYLSAAFYPHVVFFTSIHSNWRDIANQTVPVPEEWLPVEEPSFVSFDEVGSIFAGESYDNDENKDPHPQFCWMSKRIKKCMMDAKAVEYNAGVVHGDVKPSLHVGYGDVQPKRRPRFFKRFTTKFKTLVTRRTKRRTTASAVGIQDSFYTLPPSPDIPSFASSYTHQRAEIHD